MPSIPWPTAYMPCSNHSARVIRYAFAQCVYLCAFTLRLSVLTVLTPPRVYVRAWGPLTDASFWISWWKLISLVYLERPSSLTRMEIHLAGKDYHGGRKGDEIKEERGMLNVCLCFICFIWGMKSWTSSTSVRMSMLTFTWEAGIRVAWRWTMRKSGVITLTSSSQFALSPVRKHRSRYEPLHSTTLWNKQAMFRFLVIRIKINVAILPIFLIGCMLESIYLPLQAEHDLNSKSTSIPSCMKFNLEIQFLLILAAALLWSPSKIRGFMHQRIEHSFTEGNCQARPTQQP